MDSNVTLTQNQSRFWRCTAPYQDYEGAIRSGKSTIALLKLLHRHQTNPGRKSLACRWQEQDVRSQVKALIKELWPSDFLGRWNADEACFDLDDGAGGKLYVRGLKPGEDAAKFSKMAGLTLATVLIDQPEEIPESYFLYLQGRMSQPGYSHEMYLLPNPPSYDHWLAKRFPEDNRNPKYAYIRTDVYDNQANLGDDYIERLEEAYPEGHVLRRRFILGLRGLSIEGEPVYASCFSRRLHVVDQLTYNPALPLIEAWDFGHSHPAVLWGQFGLDGEWLILGEHQGRDVFLEEFLPEVLAKRASWFPDAQDIQPCCDPAGAMHTSHGTSQNAVDILHEYGVYPTYQENSNTPTVRDMAIQKISRALMRQIKGHPSVKIDGGKAPIFVDGMEAGYVWDTRSLASARNPNTRRPKKGGTDDMYSHLQDCSQYMWINSGPPSPRTKRSLEKKAEREYWRKLRADQIDHDPEDVRPKRRYHARRGIL